MNSLGRGITSKQTERGFGENSDDMFQRGKRDRKNSLEVTFDRRHLIKRAFPLTCKVPQMAAITRHYILGQGILVQEKKMCEDHCSLPVCLGLQRIGTLV